MNIDELLEALENENSAENLILQELREEKVRREDQMAFTEMALELAVRELNEVYGAVLNFEKVIREGRLERSNPDYIQMVRKAHRLCDLIEVLDEVRENGYRADF